jgi:hypothetical protein
MSSLVVTRAQVSTGSSAVVTRASLSVTQPTGSSVVVTRATVSVLQPIGSSLFVTQARVAVSPNLVANPGGSRANLHAGFVRPLSVQAQNQGTITFEWTQVSGPAVVITGSDQANASYTVPALFASDTVVLQLRVGDGQNWSAPVQVADTVVAHPSWAFIGGILSPVVPKGYAAPILPPPVVPPLVAGSVPLGTTNYTIPAGAVFVSPTGSNANAGTLAAPWQTIAHALTAVGSNAVIVLRAGTYRESITHSLNGLTIQAYPGEVVWWDGSVPVTGWTQNGSTWSAPWVNVTDRSSTFSAGAPEDPRPGWGFVNPAYPCASWPDQVWINGKWLQEVDSLAKVGPGTFFSEGVASGTNNLTWTSSRLHIGDDPTGKLVEAGALGSAYLSVGQYSQLLGMGFRRYNASQPTLGSVIFAREYGYIENCIIQECTSTGISFRRAGCGASRLTVTDSGLTNIHGTHADGLVLDRVMSLRTNRENFTPNGPSVAGVKVTASRTVTISNSIFSNNNATGIWFDVSVYDTRVYSCNLQNNNHHGIMAELSALGIYADNLITGNVAIGLYVMDTDGVRAWNNTIVGNAEANVDVNEDSRTPANTAEGRDSRQPYPDPTMTWYTTSIQVKNNIIGRPVKYALRIRDSRTSGQRAAATFGPDIDGNFYNWVSAATPWGWQQANAGVLNLSTFSAFRVNSAQEANGVAIIGTSQINADFTLTSTALAAVANAPRPLPADVAALIGQPTGATHMGAWR